MNSNVNLVRTVLKYTFGILPIVAGLDKFTNFLTDWSHYLAPAMEGMLPFATETFMIITGIIEIIAGIIVFLRPAIGGYIVMIWLLLIALNLLFSGSFLDVAVRDVVMAIGAFSLAKLSQDNVAK